MNKKRDPLLPIPGETYFGFLAQAYVLEYLCRDSPIYIRMIYPVIWILYVFQFIILYFSDERGICVALKQCFFALSMIIPLVLMARFL